MWRGVELPSGLHLPCIPCFANLPVCGFAQPPLCLPVPPSFPAADLPPSTRLSPPPPDDPAPVEKPPSFDGCAPAGQAAGERGSCRRPAPGTRHAPGLDLRASACGRYCCYYYCYYYYDYHYYGPGSRRAPPLRAHRGVGVWGLRGAGVTRAPAAPPPPAWFAGRICDTSLQLISQKATKHDQQTIKQQANNNQKQPNINQQTFNNQSKNNQQQANSNQTANHTAPKNTNNQPRATGLRASPSHLVRHSLGRVQAQDTFFLLLWSS